MISEVDIRDWEHVDVNEAKTQLRNLGHALHNDAFLDEFNYLVRFINSVELIRKKQVKQVPVLFTKAVDYEPR